LLSPIYLVVRSVLRLVVWSLRSPDAQALEVMVLRHQLEVLNRQVGRARFEHARLLLAAASRLVFRDRWHAFSVARDPPALAPPPGHPQGGEVGEQEARTTSHSTGPQQPDRPFRQGQPALGLQAHPRHEHVRRAVAQVVGAIDPIAVRDLLPERLYRCRGHRQLFEEHGEGVGRLDAFSGQHGTDAFTCKSFLSLASHLGSRTTMHPANLRAPYSIRSAGIAVTTLCGALHGVRALPAIAWGAHNTI
jgi:hypothetical protein